MQNQHSKMVFDHERALLCWSCGSWAVQNLLSMMAFDEDQSVGCCSDGEEEIDGKSI